LCLCHRVIARIHVRDGKELFGRYTGQAVTTEGANHARHCFVGGAAVSASLKVVDRAARDAGGVLQGGLCQPSNSRAERKVNLSMTEIIGYSLVHGQA
jgi:hypothetical protein